MTDAVICSPLGKMAEDMNVPWIAFMAAPPNDLVCYFEMDKIQKLFANAKSENDHIDVIPGLSSLPFKDLPHEIHLSKPSNELVPYLYRMAQKLPQAKALLLNTYEELNPIPLTNYLKLRVKNLLYIGCSTLSITQENDGSSTSTGCLFSWLDRQKVSSVVYISFGTVVELGSEELMALAEAIEYSGKPFLWSLKDWQKKSSRKGFFERNQRERNGGFLGNHKEEILPTWFSFVCLVKTHVEKAKKMRQACNELRQVLIQADGPDGVAAKNRKTLSHLISG
ncbi:flavonol 3-O-glucosyltransferase F3GT2-like [Jatropha curcas]|uniref:flavonol 3-O-glucosyltransferase F3GT2-like n=1 Tax=Jatropha curcas TaxID=180498 RepID=UPI00189449E3|nr:flavonol 3-O-glucosyltransferase F3GT2-like [Jatropha curcas]